MWALLRAGAFRWLWAGQTLSMAGDRVQEIALAWLVLSLGYSPLVLGTLLVAGAAPRAAFLVLGGAITDRIPLRRVLLVANVARCLLALILAGLALSGTAALWQLGAVEVLFGVADAFSLPAITAVLPRMMAPERLPAGNALLGISEQASMTAGPAVGGVLVAALGPAGAFGLNGLSFVAAALGATRVPSSNLAGPRAGSLLSEVRAGLKYASRLPGFPQLLLVVIASSLAFNGGFGVVLPALARTRFSAGAVGLGVMLGAWGVGQLLGAISAGITGLPPRLGWLMIGMAFATALAFGLLAVIGSPWLAALILALLGFGLAYSDDVALPVWLQHNTQPQMLGRVSSVLELCREWPAPLSFAVLGALASRDLRAAFAAAAAVMLLAALVLAASGTMRRLTLLPAER